MQTGFRARLGMITAGVFAAFSLSGCIGGLFGGDDAPPTSESVMLEEESGGSWIPFFGDDDDEDEGAAIGVNSYLWRATLDTLAFMPLQSADPFGGVIISDWYEDPALPGERFKLTVYILDQRLRADGIRVAVFRQQRSGSGWADVAVSPNTGPDIENAILTRARQLRVDSLEGT